MIRFVQPGPVAALALALALSACANEPSQWTYQDGIGRNPSGPSAAQFGQIGGGYLSANAYTWWQPLYSVDSFSRQDEIFAANVVKRGPHVSPWKRAAKEPSYRYDGASQLGGRRHDLDGYLARNPTTSLIVAKDDTILVERYQYARTDSHRFISFSMAKTVTSMLMGLAVADGKIRSIDDAAEVYEPRLAGTEYGKTPLRHLLTMSSGVQFREDYDGADDASRLTAATIGRRTSGGPEAVKLFNTRIAAPGERWYYASSETQVLGVVLRAAIGRPLAEYLSERIWQPMGAESDASWLSDASGQEAVYSSFNAVARDYARFGMLLAKGGRAGDRQLIPADWLALATKPHFSGRQTAKWFGYGFQTWIFPDNDGTFALLGVRGQTIFVDPAERLVMVHTAVRPSGRDPGGADTIALWRAVRTQSRI
jgi:CubicO group peptidase (beta-lactamase class C family)